MPRRVYLDGRCVGVIDGKVFTKLARSSHVLRVPEPSWAIAEAIFLSEIRPHCNIIRIASPETGRVYQVSVKDFEGHSFRLQRGDYESQMALPLRYWREIEQEPKGPVQEAIAAGDGLGRLCSAF